MRNTPYFEAIATEVLVKVASAAICSISETDMAAKCTCEIGIVISVLLMLALPYQSTSMNMLSATCSMCLRLVAPEAWYGEVGYLTSGMIGIVPVILMLVLQMNEFDLSLRANRIYAGLKAQHLPCHVDAGPVLWMSKRDRNPYSGTAALELGVRRVGEDSFFGIGTMVDLQCQGANCVCFLHDQ